METKTMWNQPTFVNCKISILVDPWGSSRSPRKAYAFSRRYIDDLQRMPAIPGSTWVYFSINTTVAAFRPLSEVLREHIGVAECHLRGWVHCNGLVRIRLDHNEVYDLQVRNGNILEPIKQRNEYDY